MHPLLLGQVRVVARLHHARLDDAAIAVDQLHLVDAGARRAGEPAAGADGVVHHHAPLVELLRLVEGERLGAVPLAVGGERAGVGLGVDLLPRLLRLVGVGVVGDGQGEHRADVDLVGLERLLQADAALDLVRVLNGEHVAEHVGPDKPADNELDSSNVSVEHWDFFLGFLFKKQIHTLFWRKKFFFCTNKFFFCFNLFCFIFFQNFKKFNDFLLL